MLIKVKYVYVIHSNAHAFRKGLNIKRGNVNTVIINTGIYDSLINCLILNLDTFKRMIGRMMKMMNENRINIQNRFSGFIPFFKV